MPGGCAAPLVHVHAHLKSRRFHREAARVLQRPPGLRRRSCFGGAHSSRPLCSQKVTEEGRIGNTTHAGPQPQCGCRRREAEQGGSHSVAGEGAEPW